MVIFSCSFGVLLWCPIWGCTVSISVTSQTCLRVSRHHLLRIALARQEWRHQISSFDSWDGRRERFNNLIALCIRIQLSTLEACCRVHFPSAPGFFTTGCNNHLINRGRLINGRDGTLGCTRKEFVRQLKLSAKTWYYIAETGDWQWLRKVHSNSTGPWKP